MSIAQNVGRPNQPHVARRDAATKVSKLPQPQAPEGAPFTHFCQRGGNFGPKRSNSIGQPGTWRQGIIPYSFYNAGVQLFDVSNPADPKIAGYYVPRLANTTELPEYTLGKGVLALTIDQGEHTQRYQGIVQLDGASLEEVARVYFRQSEQIPTEVRLGVARQRLRGDAGQPAHWRAGGALIQFLPQSTERMRQPDLPGGDGDDAETGLSGPADDAWQTARALFLTADIDELTDPTVGTERLLFRLFHEHGVRVYDGTPVVDDCSCSRDRIREILSGFTAEEIVESTEDGRIRVNCEFCSTEYFFDPAEFGDQAPGRTLN